MSSAGGQTVDYFLDTAEVSVSFIVVPVLSITMQPCSLSSTETTWSRFKSTSLSSPW